MTPPPDAVPSSPVVFADSHVHLADPAFAADRDDVVARARAAGAALLVCIGESPERAVAAAGIAEASAGLVRFTAGRHPHDAAHWLGAAEADAIRAHVADGAVAIGECGLDYHYDHSPRDVQRRVFAEQLALAQELARPVVVHTRDADDDTRDMLRDAAAAGIRGVLHCFSGGPALADAAIEAGWSLSFSGIVTFKRYTDDALLARVPEAQLLVESDAPYLAPVPHRGHRNESAWVSLTLARVAAARGVGADVLGPIVLANTRRFFGIAEAADPSSS